MPNEMFNIVIIGPSQHLRRITGKLSRRGGGLGGVEDLDLHQRYCR